MVISGHFREKIEIFKLARVRHTALNYEILVKPRCIAFETMPTQNNKLYTMKNKTNLKNNMKFKLLILAASTISSQLSQNISVKTVQNLVQNLTYPIKKSDTKSSYSAGLGSEDDEIHFNSIFEGFQYTRIIISVMAVRAQPFT